MDGRTPRLGKEVNIGSMRVPQLGVLEDGSSGAVERGRFSNITSSVHDAHLYFVIPSDPRPVIESPCPGFVLMCATVMLWHANVTQFVSRGLKKSRLQQFQTNFLGGVMLTRPDMRGEKKVRGRSLVRTTSIFSIVYSIARSPIVFLKSNHLPQFRLPCTSTSWMIFASLTTSAPESDALFWLNFPVFSLQGFRPEWTAYPEHC